MLILSSALEDYLIVTSSALSSPNCALLLLCSHIVNKILYNHGSAFQDGYLSFSLSPYVLRPHAPRYCGNMHVNSKSLLFSSPVPSICCLFLEKFLKRPHMAFWIAPAGDISPCSGHLIVLSAVTISKIKVTLVSGGVLSFASQEFCTFIAAGATEHLFSIAAQAPP